MTNSFCWRRSKFSRTYQKMSIKNALKFVHWERTHSNMWTFCQHVGWGFDQLVCQHTHTHVGKNDEWIHVWTKEKSVCAIGYRSNAHVCVCVHYADLRMIQFQNFCCHHLKDAFPKLENRQFWMKENRKWKESLECGGILAYATTKPNNWIKCAHTHTHAHKEKQMKRKPDVVRHFIWQQKHLISRQFIRKQ